MHDEDFDFGLGVRDVGHSLKASCSAIPDCVDEDAEAAWATEISRRVQELDSGAVRAVPWAEARRRIVGA